MIRSGRYRAGGSTVDAAGINKRIRESRRRGVHVNITVHPFDCMSYLVSFSKEGKTDTLFLMRSGGE